MESLLPSPEDMFSLFERFFRVSFYTGCLRSRSSVAHHLRIKLLAVSCAPKFKKGLIVSGIFLILRSSHAEAGPVAPDRSAVRAPYDKVVKAFYGRVTVTPGLRQASI
jgi:hypothetical protein